MLYLCTDCTCNMWTCVCPYIVDTPVTEGGENFSVGQRQVNVSSVILN